MDKSKRMLVLIIILLVALIGTIVGIAWYVITQVQKPAEQAEITPPPVVEVDLTKLETLDVGEFTCNLRQESQTPNYFQFHISLEVNGEKDKDGEFLALLEKKLDMIRDRVNQIVPAWSRSELMEVNGTALLKEQILTELREVFRSNLIWQVNLFNYKYM
ncbi:MAG: flagellar basal body-associated FliL family protein [Clostridiales bacterium]|jgi:flagellar basal body-associated protein FliL|nr:flagellar basal body-associated FliL family protein [Clostridiales bacterium]